MTVYDAPQGKMQLNRCMEEARALGFETVTELDMKTLRTWTEPGEQYQANQCGSFDHRWGRPPELDEPGKCREALTHYGMGVLVQTSCPGSTGAEALTQMKQLHQTRFAALCDTLRQLGEAILPLAEGGCDRCETCSYPRSCPTPERMCCCAAAFGLSLETICRETPGACASTAGHTVFSSVLLFDWRQDPDTIVHLIGRCAIEGKVGDLIRWIHQALDEQIPPQRIAMAMTEHFLTDDDSRHPVEQDLSRLLQGARSISRGMEELRPYLGVDSGFYRYTAVVGTASGDLHDLGKNLVGMMLEAAGFRVVDLGIDISAEDFARAVSQDDSVRLVGVSCLLTTSLTAVEKIVQKLNRHPRRKHFKVTVGGGATNETFAARIGADAYTRSAVDAAEYARDLLKELQQSQS